MRAMIVGAGRMGRAAAWDLGRQPGINSVSLVDRDKRVAEQAASEIAELLKGQSGGKSIPELVPVEYDLESSDGHAELVLGHDVVLSSADYRFHLPLTCAAIAARAHFCDLGGNIFVVREQLALNDAAEKAGVTVVPDCGLAPGLACLLGAWGVEQFQRADDVKIRVGGLPAHPKPPLNYKLVFSVRGLTNEYLEPAEVLSDGKVRRLASLTELESVTFPEPYGQLEAFHTSGGASTLPHTLQGRVKNLDYKTLRYPGHCAIFSGMKALGLFSENVIDGVVPREFFERMLVRSLVDDDSDVVLLRVSVSGEREGKAMTKIFEVIDKQNPDTRHSAMARTTAYPAAAMAYMLATGAIQKRGVLPGELCTPLAEYVQAVRARGIDIRERWV